MTVKNLNGMFKIFLQIWPFWWSCKIIIVDNFNVRITKLHIENFNIKLSKFCAFNIIFIMIPSKWIEHIISLDDSVKKSSSKLFNYWKLNSNTVWVFPNLINQQQVEHWYLKQLGFFFLNFNRYLAINVLFCEIRHSDVNQ